MVLFLLIDTSGSMYGSKIGTLNTAIEEMIPDLRDLSESNADAQIKIAVLEFSSGARWFTPSGPLNLEDFVWNRIEADGVTDLGDACRELNKKLSKNEFMQEATGSFAPAIFLMSDGGPTDDYAKELEILKQNNWFKRAIKVALAVGSDADMNVLAEFTGTPEAVVEVHNASQLKKMIKFVSVRASEVASRSSNAGIESTGEFTAKQADMIDQLKSFEDELQNDVSCEDIEW
jgi:uncharacterized protein YegL